MSKNDNVVRVWRGEKTSEPVAHWYFEGDGWIFCELGTVSAGEQFCLNDAEHRPPLGLETTSLEGLV